MHYPKSRARCCCSLLFAVPFLNCDPGCLKKRHSHCMFWDSTPSLPFYQRFRHNCKVSRRVNTRSLQSIFAAPGSKLRRLLMRENYADKLDDINIVPVAHTCRRKFNFLVKVWVVIELVRGFVSKKNSWRIHGRRKFCLLGATKSHWHGNFRQSNNK